MIQHKHILYIILHIDFAMLWCTVIKHHTLWPRNYKIMQMVHISNTHKLKLYYPNHAEFTRNDAM